MSKKVDPVLIPVDPVHGAHSQRVKTPRYITNFIREDMWKYDAAIKAAELEGVLDIARHPMPADFLDDYRPENFPDLYSLVSYRGVFDLTNFWHEYNKL